MWELGIKKVETVGSPLFYSGFEMMNPKCHLVLAGKISVLLSVVVAELKR